MKKLLLTPALVILLFSMASSVSARSGCCSHHGGVCGCGCCDGTSLSTTCSPYYPECSRPVYVAPVATAKPSTPRPTLRPTQAPTSTPTIETEVLGVSSTEQPLESPIVSQTIEPKVAGDKKENPIVGLGILGALVYGTIKFLGWKEKKLKKDEVPTV